MKKISRKGYDSVLKGLFQRDRPSALLDLLTGGVPVRQVLNVELSKPMERRVDSVFLLEDDTVFHLEYQIRNDKEMAYREGIYCLLLGKKYRRRIRQTVIYLGKPKMRMPNQLDLGQTKVAYTLLDIRDIDAAMLMASGQPADLPLAMLARGGAEKLQEILRRAANLRGGEREKVIGEIAALSGLRRLEGELIMEVERMATFEEIFSRVPKFQAMIRTARMEGSRTTGIQLLRGQLKQKFRKVPEWADQKLESATPVQIRRWSNKVLTAQTLEEVIGKK